MKPKQLTNQRQKKEVTAKNMLWRNHGCTENNSTLKYTKEQYTKAKGCTAQAMIKWNKFFPKAEQFTADEITESKTQRHKQSL